MSVDKCPRTRPEIARPFGEVMRRKNLDDVRLLEFNKRFVGKETEVISFVTR